MIKLTQVASEIRSAPPMFLIPGGPGLSSNTLRSLDILRRSFELFFVDLPGTNGVPFEGPPFFAELCEEISYEISRVGSPSFVLGHSFGGFFAARVALDTMNVNGLACLATPFSKESQQAGGENYVDARTEALAAAEKKWQNTPSALTMAEWLSLYGGLYFTKDKEPDGRDLLANDDCSHELFLALRSEASKMGGLLSEVQGWKGNKVFIAGTHDGLLPVEMLRREAQEGGFSFHAVPEASHFAMFDRPIVVAELLEKLFLTSREGEK